MTKGIDLGLTGRRAIVCGSSSGLGFACAMSLAQAGATVTLNGRDADRLTAAAERIAEATGARPAAVAADVATEEGRAQLLGAAGHVDILVTNAGGPPAGDFRSFTEEQWQAAFRTNTLSAIFLIKGVIDPMIAQRWGRIINITSAAVKAPIAALSLSNAARAGLTGFTAGLARQVAKDGVTVNNLLPGPFATDRLRGFAKASGAAQGKSQEEMLEAMAADVPAGRIGDPAEFGWWCAFFASAQGSFVTGQNLLIDGGSYPGTL